LCELGLQRFVLIELLDDTGAPGVVFITVSARDTRTRAARTFTILDADRGEVSLPRRLVPLIRAT